MKKITILLATVLLLVVLLRIYKKGEGRLQGQTSIVLHQNEYLVHSKGSYQQYKKEQGRNAEYDFRDVTLASLLLKEQKSYRFTNYGIHSASKAVPLPGNNFVLAANDSGTLAAFDSLGNVKWTFGIANSSRGIHSTPAVDEHSIYFGGYNGKFYRINKETGGLLWSLKLGFAIGASPLIVDDYVFVNVELPQNGYVAKVLRDTGMVIWTSEFLGEQSHSSVSFHEATKSLIVGDNGKVIRAIDFESGKTKWKYNAEGEVKNAPVIFEDRVYFNTWGKKLYCLDVTTGNVIWARSLKDKSQSAPVIDTRNRLVFASDYTGTVTAFDLTGKVVWEKPYKLPEKNFGNLTVLHFRNKSFLVVPQTKEVLFKDIKTGNDFFTMKSNGTITSEFVPVIEKNELTFYYMPHKGELEKVVLAIK